MDLFILETGCSSGMGSVMTKKSPPMKKSMSLLAIVGFLQRFLLKSEL
jgi:hypothetical protein